MEIRLLGPFEIESGGVLVAPRGVHPRAVAAVLALQPGRVVAIDTLVDSLWGDDLPASPANALQVAVARLRAALGPAGTAVVTRAPGYLLDVSDRDVDAVRFEAGVRAATATLERGDAVAAAAAARQALASWRGAPLAEFGHLPFVVPAARRLEELRHAAFMAAVDAELQLGRHRDLVSELEDAVARESLRESLHERLMVALYRSGRQADALRAYSAARMQLGDQLGVEPGPALKRLELAILRHDPALDAPAAPTSPQSGGREARPLDASIEVWLPAGSRVVGLTGGRVTIGKAGSNGVAIEGDRLVSRLHAVLERLGPGWCIRDLGSRNGTSVNGERLVRERVLRGGDEIVVGETHLVFRDAADDLSLTEAAEPPPPLTPRQRQVLIALCRPVLSGSLLAAPASVRDIAAELVMTDADVGECLEQLYQEFAVAGKGPDRPASLATEAVRRAAVTLADSRG